ncbi:MAG: hypothetical protein Kow0099_06600 [Candidatus Abyssubacteria bacterium]
MSDNAYIRWFEELGSRDVPIVGGKNASLGEMIRTLKQEEIRVPGGFATTANAYRAYLKFNNITDEIEALLRELTRGDKPLAQSWKIHPELFHPGEISGRNRRCGSTRVPGALSAP